MANFFARYWKIYAVSSVSFISSYLYSHYDQSQLNDRLLSILTVHAAEYVREILISIKISSNFYLIRNDEIQKK